MSTAAPEFCLPRAEDAHFEPMQDFHDWLKIRDFGLSEATHGRYDARLKMDYEGEFFELAAPANQAAIDV